MNTITILAKTLQNHNPTIINPRSLRIHTQNPTPNTNTPLPPTRPTQHHPPNNTHPNHPPHNQHQTHHPPTRRPQPHPQTQTMAHHPPPTMTPNTIRSTIYNHLKQHYPHIISQYTLSIGPGPNPQDQDKPSIITHNPTNNTIIITIYHYDKGQYWITTGTSIPLADPQLFQKIKTMIEKHHPQQ